jgi:hypothetical protein
VNRKSLGTTALSNSGTETTDLTDGLTDMILLHALIVCTTFKEHTKSDYSILFLNYYINHKAYSSLKILSLFVSRVPF